MYRNPGILAATRVARQQPDAPKKAPKPVVAQQTTAPSVAAQTAMQAVTPQTAPQPTIVKALSTPVQTPIPDNGPVRVNTQVPIVLPTGPVKKVAAKTVMTLHETPQQTTNESDENETNSTHHVSWTNK